MNDFGQLTLYDFLTMLIIGVLILAPFCIFSCGLDFINTTVFLIASYIIGLCYHKILEWLQSRLRFRNMKCMIRKAFRVTCKEFPHASGLVKDMDKIKGPYYREYYRLMMKGCLGNIPVLEAHVAFLRNLIPIVIMYIVMSMCDCSGVSGMIDCIFGDGSKCAVGAVLMIILILLPILWYCTQMKIHKLVWEGGYFISIIGNTQNQQSQPHASQSTIAKP